MSFGLWDMQYPPGQHGSCFDVLVHQLWTQELLWEPARSWELIYSCQVLGICWMSCNKALPRSKGCSAFSNIFAPRTGNWSVGLCWAWDRWLQPRWFSACLAENLSNEETQELDVEENAEDTSKQIPENPTRWPWPWILESRIFWLTLTAVASSKLPVAWIILGIHTSHPGVFPVNWMFCWFLLLAADVQLSLQVSLIFWRTWQKIKTNKICTWINK